MTDLRNEPLGDPQISGAQRSASGAFLTYLTSYDSFPLDLSGISTLELHVLNSRICRQREWEYASVSGPHSETEERFHELQAELDARDIAADRNEP